MRGTTEITNGGRPDLSPITDFWNEYGQVDDVEVAWDMAHGESFIEITRRDTLQRLKKSPETTKVAWMSVYLKICNIIMM